MRKAFFGLFTVKGSNDPNLQIPFQKNWKFINDHHLTEAHRLLPNPRGNANNKNHTPSQTSYKKAPYGG